MKTNNFYFFLFIFSFFYNGLFAQIKFEPGYFITNDDNKVECFIKNQDWENNPEFIEYKTTENGEKQKTSIETIKEFGINGFSKYKKAKVKFDTSPTNLKDLSYLRNPIFVEKSLFLKVLLEGKATLYEYENELGLRYFFNIANDSIKPLIYKKYQTSATSVAENVQFKQQLLIELKCEKLKESKINGAKYLKTALINIFETYNSCFETQTTSFEKMRDEKRVKNRLWIYINGSLNKVNVTTPLGSFKKGETFDNIFGLNVGFDYEVIFNTNKNKLAFVPGIFYHTLKYIKDDNFSVNFGSLEIPIMLRYYFFLNDNTKLSLNAGIGIFYNLNYESFYEQRALHEFNIYRTNFTPSFGINLTHKKFGIQAKYFLNRYLMSAGAFNQKITTISFGVSYQIF